MDGFETRMLARMPLAEAVMLLWRDLADERRLQAIYQQHRGRCYESVISFPTMVHLVSDALLQHGGSGNQSFSRAQESGQLEASVRAAYDKLGRMPLSLSKGFLAASADRLRTLFPKKALREPPTSLQAFTVITIDGKTMKRVAKRLKPVRGTSGGVLGGKALVATEFRTGMALAMSADPDGHANDVKLVPELLADVRQRVEGVRLWLEDSQFCDLIQMGRFTEAGDHFLVRYNAKVGFHPDTSRKVRHGLDNEGRAFVDEWGHLGAESQKLRRYVRRVRLTISETEEISVVTDLEDANEYPAADLLDMYRERSGIEWMFQKVVEVFGLHSLIGGTPEATIFQFAFCLLLYNQTQLVRGYVAAEQQLEYETISLQQIFIDVRRELIAWTVVVPNSVALEYFEKVSVSASPSRLRKLLNGQWSIRWIKATNKKRRSHPKRKKTQTHQSVYRLLQSQQK